MGALTLKSFPFELRGWDLSKLPSLDPTDGFASYTQVYVNKNQVIQIEPDLNTNSTNWLTDKGRQFFDGIFGDWRSNKKESLNSLKLTNKDWLEIIKRIIRTLYAFEHCGTQQNNNNLLTILFESLSIEMLSLLKMISQSQPFVKLRRVESLKSNNNLETNFQLNFANKVKLNSSTLCLLISTNPRYEGYQLNLNLRQRFLKGDFKCLNIGSLINITFPILYLGSKLNIFKTIIEGNNLICQEFKCSNNPTLIINSEFLKRNYGKENLEMLKVLKYTHIFNTFWKGLNILSSSLNETGTQAIEKVLPLRVKDLANFSLLYLLNVTPNNLPNIRKIMKLKMLNQITINNNISQIFLDQNNKINNNMEVYNTLTNSKLEQYYHLPSSMFYENEETFINTEGIIRRSNKVILKRKTKNNWQILRRIFKHLQVNLKFLIPKNNNLVLFNNKKINNFKKYIHLHYQATQTLTSINFYIQTQNKNFMLFSDIINFKQRRMKLKTTKLKYWLYDFFTGGKDEHSQSSKILSNCSKILRIKSTNFF